MAVRTIRAPRRSAPVNLASNLGSGKITEREGALEDMARQAKAEAEEARRRHGGETASRATPLRRVRMIQSRKGSPDGVRTVLYEAGTLYALPEALAGPWIAKGIAEEEKSVERAPELK